MICGVRTRGYIRSGGRDHGFHGVAFRDFRDPKVVSHKRLPTVIVSPHALEDFNRSRSPMRVPIEYRTNDICKSRAAHHHVGGIKTSGKPTLDNSPADRSR